MKLCKTCACMRKDPTTGNAYCAYLPMQIVTVYQETEMDGRTVRAPYHASIQPGISDPEKQGCELGWTTKAKMKAKPVLPSTGGW